MVTGLTNGTSYAFQVRAVNAEGDGAASAKASVIPGGKPFPPENLTAVAGDREVTLRWTAGSDNGVRLVGHQYRRSDSEDGDGNRVWGSWTDIPSSAPGQTNARSYTVAALANSTVHAFQVRAENTASPFYSSASGTVMATVGSPAAPVGLTAVAGDGEVALSWTAGPDHGSAITGWQVRRGTDGGATWDQGLDGHRG